VAALHDTEHSKEAEKIALKPRLQRCFVSALCSSDLPGILDLLHFASSVDAEAIPYLYHLSRGADILP
jgi:hypothetical protein